VPVNVDDSRLDPPGLRYRTPEKALRIGGIAVPREEKVDGVAGRVDGSI